MTSEMRPKLRRIQASPGHWQGQPVIVLRDPLGLVDMAVAIPRNVAPFLELCDGTRDVATLSTALELRTGLRLWPGYVEKMLAELDEALLLENERFAQAYRETVERFRSNSFRLPTLAGTVYPANPEGLDRTFTEYFDMASSEAGDVPDIEQVRGLVSPHIDYNRGAAIYAEVWRRAAAAVREAEVAVILGTNHSDCEKLITMTQQSYSTPWGVLPTASDVVDKVAAALGEEEVFAEELHHRGEHSVEIAAVWLHYLVKDKVCELVPVLCGSFHKFVAGEGQPGEDEQVTLFIDTVREATADRRTLIVAAGDLAHMGPAFGDHYPVDGVGRADISVADGELMDTIARGDAEGMFLQVKKEGDRRRICGLPPIYLALRLLGETTGKVTGYAQCSADQQETSLVSICGMVFI
ncbi:MAG: AmmeMemoRadiSam system protein B [Dehalococcoidia bacterium]